MGQIQHEIATYLSLFTAINVTLGLLTGIAMGVLDMPNPIFWGWMWGAVGVLMAVPILSVLKIISRNMESLKVLEAVLK